MNHKRLISRTKILQNTLFVFLYKMYIQAMHWRKAKASSLNDNAQELEHFLQLLLTVLSKNQCAIQVVLDIVFAASRPKKILPLSRVKQEYKERYSV